MNDTDSSISDFIRGVANNITGFLAGQQRELIRYLRVPTPQKVTFVVQADGTGTIGGGFANPTPIFIYQCPVSQEAWIHRISVTSPSGTPKAPLTTGQLMAISGAGEPLFFLPTGGVVAPVTITEGRGSAAHLNPGSRMSIYGDSFPPNTALRFDLQILLDIGVSNYAPFQAGGEKAQVLE